MGDKAEDREKIDEAEGELTFEQALTRLEEIVEALEGGQATLEESLSLFKEGMRLKGLCETKLDQAEQAIRKLVVASGGEIVEDDFDGV